MPSSELELIILYVAAEFCMLAVEEADDDPVAPAAVGLPPGTVVRDVEVFKVPWPPEPPVAVML